jgi:hypothetical protein
MVIQEICRQPPDNRANELAACEPTARLGAVRRCSCLLVSTPMYQRTRPGWSPGRFPPARFLPGPRRWADGPILCQAVGGAFVEDDPADDAMLRVTAEGRLGSGRCGVP